MSVNYSTLKLLKAHFNQRMLAYEFFKTSLGINHSSYLHIYWDIIGYIMGKYSTWNRLTSVYVLPNSADNWEFTVSYCL